MKKISIVLFTIGLITLIGLVIYFRSAVNPVDSDYMAISRNGHYTSRWPIFIGIIMTFVGGVFFFVSISQKNIKK